MTLSALNANLEFEFQINLCNVYSIFVLFSFFAAVIFYAVVWFYKIYIRRISDLFINKFDFKLERKKLKSQQKQQQQ